MHIPQDFSIKYHRFPVVCEVDILANLLELLKISRGRLEKSKGYNTQDILPLEINLYWWTEHQKWIQNSSWALSMLSTVSSIVHHGLQIHASVKDITESKSAYAHDWNADKCSSPITPFPCLKAFIYGTIRNSCHVVLHYRLQSLALGVKTCLL